MRVWYTSLNTSLVYQASTSSGANVPAYTTTLLLAWYTRLVPTSSGRIENYYFIMPTLYFLKFTKSLTP